ncbi:MAG: riboflavin synthase [Chloroflexi bacterium]|nr:riboflavin synthase [Chloroflexota bacterium]
MFTGIVEEVGRVRAASPAGLTIDAERVLGDLRISDSISVDGVCLTVIERDERGFSIGLQPETLRRSTMGLLRPGQRVNLERAVSAGGRLGGHIVQGHVDATGTIRDYVPEGDSIVARFGAPRDLMPYIVRKGFIAVDGISLTVVDVGPDWFTVALVRYTQEHVGLLDKGPGDRVNLEVDILGKYVERLLAERFGATG